MVSVDPFEEQSVKVIVDSITMTYRGTILVEDEEVLELEPALTMRMLEAPLSQAKIAIIPEVVDIEGCKVND